MPTKTQGAVCDFCSDPEVAWAYQVPDFVMQELRRPGELVQQLSTGGWAACQACAALIDAGDEEGLLTRSVTEMLRLNPAIHLLGGEPVVRRVIAPAQQKFFLLRDTHPELCGKEPV